MRIVYLHQYFNTPQASGGTRSYEMARRLVSAGHEVHIVTTWRGGSTSNNWFETIEDGVQVHWVPIPYSNHMSSSERLQAFMRFACLAGPRACQVGPDVVLASSTPLTIALPAVYAAKRSRVPMVFEVRDLWPEVPIALGELASTPLKIAARSLEKFAYRNAARVIALSPGMAEGVRRTGYPAERIHVIPNSADNSLFRVPPDVAESFLEQHPELRGRKFVLYPGTFGLVNGVTYLVEMAAHLARISDIHVVLLGDGRDRSAVLDTARLRDVLGRSLHVLDPKPKVAMPSAFAAAAMIASTVVNVPALWNNSANKFFDALAAARPVFINHEGWQADLIRTHKVGVVGPPEAPEVAAHLVADFLADSMRREIASRAAARLADTMFSRDELAVRLRQVIEGAVATSASL